MSRLVTLEHGEGGLLTHRLIKEVFIERFGSPSNVLEDSAIVRGAPRIALTTDGFVVKPYRFPGGDIGRLAVAGTYNDLVVRGASPRYLLASFIIEEGFPIDELCSVADSMKAESLACGMQIVAGDTKVVARGECDQIFISSSGVGVVPEGVDIGVTRVKHGDTVLVTGDIGRHGATLLTARLGLESSLVSDVGSMTYLEALQSNPGVHCMRDLTRGGLATVLCEVQIDTGLGVELLESRVPLCPEVAAICEIAGVDPLYLPCEGRAVIYCDHDESDAVCRALAESGQAAICIGKVTQDSPFVRIVTKYGGTRRLSMLIGAELPRMC